MNHTLPTANLDAIISELEVEFEDLGPLTSVTDPIEDTNTCDTCTCPCSTD